jgi:two-component system response regulator AtoC
MVALNMYRLKQWPAPARGVDTNPPLSTTQDHIHALARRFARSRLPILIIGETGTGKEVLANRIHHWSPRASGPLRAINCGALPENLIEAILFGHEKGAFTGAVQSSPGVFEHADGGTLFLDEIGELRLAAQVALLRVLETRRIQPIGGSSEREIDVRIIAATHQDLERHVAEGRFRSDLLYRLNAVTLRIPPLRERTEEIPELVQYFLTSEEIPEDAPRLISSSALERLFAYPWPGNLRELRNVVEHAAVAAAGSTIEIHDLPEAFHHHPKRLTLTAGPEILVAVPAAEPISLRPSAASMRERLAAYELALIRAALRQTAGHKAKAARLLNMPIRTLMKRLKEHRMQ